EVIDLGNDFVEPIDFLDDDFVKIFSEIRVVETFWEKLCKGLDRHKRVSNFMRHARGEIGPEGSAIDQILFLAQVVLCGQVVEDSDGSEGCFLVQQPPSFHGKRSTRIGVNPLSSGEILFRIEGLAQKRRESATARCLDGLI